MDALAHALACDRPVLELRVTADAAGQPRLDEGAWHHRAVFTPPALPHELDGLSTALTGLPSVDAYCAALKTFSSHTSRERQRLFKRAALWVVGAHVAATLCAVIALKLAGSGLVPVILAIELALLAGGLLLHESLHGGRIVRALRRLPGSSPLDGLAHAVRVWAMSRLTAECARSTLALRDVPAPLGHLFTLPLPAALRPVLRTLNVLHLRDTRSLPPQAWSTRRDDYLHSRIFRRLKQKDPGQIRYYHRELRAARRQSAWARAAFLAGSVGAFAATAGKLLSRSHGAGAALLGGAAILLPVLAVAAMSLAAAYDLEGRVHTYREMLGFLRAQRRRLRRAPTEHAFRHLALETEARLLGETAAWHARRAFTGIA